MANQPQGQESEQSAFNTRADSAALRVKDQLGRELSAMTGEQVVLPPTPVPVGPDGQPAGPLPPEGSYAREQIQQQQAAAAQHAQAMAYQQVQVPPQQPDQQVPTQPPPQEPPDSQRVQERISALTTKLRDKDQDMLRLQQQQTEQAQRIEQQQQQLAARDQQMESLLQDQLENLDPDTRQQVLNDARTRELLAQSEARILQSVNPQLERLQQRNMQLEKGHLSESYQRYDPLVHDGLIDEFRRANQSCSVEQAFRAIATPEELNTGGGGHANVVPPTLPPGNGSQQPRYLPNQVNEPDPVEQMRDDARRASELARSMDPEDQKKSQALFHKNIADRLGGIIPGR